MKGSCIFYLRLSPELIKALRAGCWDSIEKAKTFLWVSIITHHITRKRKPFSCGDPEEIAAKMKDLNGRRKDKQPLEYPSAGSTFKRPEGFYAAALIDQCGLKGYSVGGAQVSLKHAGFLVNSGNSSKDYLELVRTVQRIVRERAGVELEPEIRIIGEEV